METKIGIAFFTKTNILLELVCKFAYMKKIMMFLVVMLMHFSLTAQQTPLPFFIQLEEMFIPQAPAIQSYAFGVYNERWIFMGGRISGLHGQNPFNSFPADSANNHIWMIDPASQQVWSSPLSSLSASLEKQLLGTNPSFTQHDSILYVVGGYGYDVLSNQYDTWPYITVVNLSLLHDALQNGTSANNAFTQIQDNRMAVTGGHLSMDSSTFYLVGGQKFSGRYNPNGMPSYTQTYTNAIRTFELLPSSPGFIIQNYNEIIDAQELHRRDYNMADQIFPDGSFGFTAFSGVFRPTADLPWFNVVDIKDQSYNAISENVFQQRFNQYHGARMPIYDVTINEMHTMFFGGIGMYTWDSINQVPVADSAVPFVKTISMVTRYADSSMEERIFPQSMPGYLGASAEFIPGFNTPLVKGEVILYDNLNYPGKNLAGYIYGGIESYQPNMFMQPTGSSHATNRIFKVFVMSPPFSIPEQINVHQLETFPNPGGTSTSLYLPWKSKHPALSLTDIAGKQFSPKYHLEENRIIVDTDGLTSGMYFLLITESNQKAIARFVKI